jgi:hypothetical protein
VLGVTSISIFRTISLIASILFGIEKVSEGFVPVGTLVKVPLITEIPEPLIYFTGGLDIKSDDICLELSALFALETDWEPEELNV